MTYRSSRPTVHLVQRALLGMLSCFVSMVLFISFFVLFATPSHALADFAVVNENVPVIYNSCDAQATVFAAMQGWHGLNNHNIFQNPPYRSNDDQAIARQVALAKQLCIDALIVDWFGPTEVEQVNPDRNFIDEVVQKLLDAAGNHVQVALMYDMKTLATVRLSGEPQQDSQRYTAQVIADLQYAVQEYFAAESYLRIQEQPVLFVFPDERFPVDWPMVRQILQSPLLLIGQAMMIPAADAPVEDFQCQDEFDGFYGWVRPANGMWDGQNIGAETLQIFYDAMQDPTNPCHAKMLVGGVWPGFDDSTAHWQATPIRHMPRNCGETWNHLWALADTHTLDYVMINTLNDFEEGSAIEFGVVDLRVTQSVPMLPGETIALSATLADCTQVNYQWELGNGNLATGAEIQAQYEEAGNYTIVVTATDSVTTTVQSVPLVVSNFAWRESFASMASFWTQPTARWILTDTVGVLTEDNPTADFGKVESAVMRVNVDDYPLLYLIAAEIDVDASLTVQLLNKGAPTAFATVPITVANVITGFAQSDPKLIEVNYAELLNWQGVQYFTINLWINGEGKSAQLQEMAIISRNGVRPIGLDRANPIYLPLILH